MLWFIFLCVVQGIVDHAKTGCLSATKMGPEAKDKNDVRCCLVHFGQLFTNFSFGDRGLSGMKNVNHLQVKDHQNIVSLKRFLYTMKAQHWKAHTGFTDTVIHMWLLVINCKAYTCWRSNLPSVTSLHKLSTSNGRMPSITKQRALQLSCIFLNLTFMEGKETIKTVVWKHRRPTS